MPRAVLTLAFAMVALVVCAEQAQAQSSGLFGNRGVTGGSTGNRSVAGGSRTGSGSTASAVGNAGSMTGFTGQTASSQAGYASGAQAGGAIAGMTNTGFVGNRNASNAVGTAGGNLGASTTSRTNRSTAGRSGGGSGSRNGQNRNNFNMGGQFGMGSAATTLPRPTHHIAFDYNPRPAAQTHASVQTNLARVNQGRLKNIAVESGDNGTVTLRGTVASEADKRMAEMSTRLEPGVRSVVNELTVATP